MHAYKKRRCLAILGLVLGIATFAAEAEFRITQITPRIADKSLALSGTLDLGLTTKVEEALSKGIPMEIIIDINLHRRRSVLWDPRLQSWVLRRKISYHALSRQYLVIGHKPDSSAVESFTSLQAALVNMGSLQDSKLVLQQPLNSGAKYYVGVRASLDIEALPAPLRPVAYTSLAWHLSSGWTEWNVQK